MFDVGFSEMLLIAVVALVVIGPERLPKVARTLGLLLGRLQRYVSDVKADISREMELDELRKFKSEFESAAQSAESAFRADVASAEAQINALASDVSPEKSAHPPAAASDSSVVPSAVGTPAQPDLFPAQGFSAHGQMTDGNAGAKAVDKA